MRLYLARRHFSTVVRLTCGLRRRLDLIRCLIQLLRIRRKLTGRIFRWDRLIVTYMIVTRSSRGVLILGWRRVRTWTRLVRMRRIITLGTSRVIVRRASLWMWCVCLLVTIGRTVLVVMNLRQLALCTWKCRYVSSRIIRASVRTCKVVRH